MFHIMIFFGTRPEIIKMAPLIRKIEKSDFKLTLIHSGQHYDHQMSAIFLEELDLRKIDENLEIGSGSHGIQTSKMIKSYEEMILKYKPDIVLAEGDTNSVVAAGIVCAKLNIPFGHVEAGIRSYDMTMPEEINRRLAGVTAALHFSPSKQAVLNLYYEGFDPKRIYLTGNTIVDATLEHAEIALKKSIIFQKMALPTNKPLLLVTTHRPANVDYKDSLEQICKALITLNEFIIIFPVHPRTMKNLEVFQLKESLLNANHIFLIEPLGYLDFLMVMQKSDIILTDSGGLQEEALTLKKPCITLRENTERPETVKLGVNFLVGSDSKKIIATVRTILRNNTIHKKLINIKNPYGDGNASKRILEIITERLKAGDLPFSESHFTVEGSAEYKLIITPDKIEKSKFEEKFNAKITLVYNEKGEPELIPKVIPKGWFIRIQK